MKTYYVAFMFSTVVEAETEDKAISLAEKAMAENGLTNHVNEVNVIREKEPPVRRGISDPVNLLVAFLLKKPDTKSGKHGKKPTN